MVDADGRPPLLLVPGDREARLPGGLAAVRRRRLRRPPVAGQGVHRPRRASRRHGIRVVADGGVARPGPWITGANRPTTTSAACCSTATSPSTSGARSPRWSRVTPAPLRGAGRPGALGGGRPHLPARAPSTPRSCPARPSWPRTAARPSSPWGATAWGSAGCWPWWPRSTTTSGAWPGPPRWPPSRSTWRARAPAAPRGGRGRRRPLRAPGGGRGRGPLRRPGRVPGGQVRRRRPAGDARSAWWSGPRAWPGGSWSGGPGPPARSGSCRDAGRAVLAALTSARRAPGRPADGSARPGPVRGETARQASHSVERCAAILSVCRSVGVK